jgi:flagellar basal-body rod protein FlgB
MNGRAALAQLLLIFVKRHSLRRIKKETNMSKRIDTIDLLEAGIRAEELRQKTIANNVANLETPGYRRVDVKFEDLLAKALDSSSGSGDIKEMNPQVYQPKETAVKSNGNDVSFEVEVGEMVKNTLRHKAYVRLLGKKFKQIEMAMDIK